MKITSVNNELIKETAKLLQKKYRDESGLFLLEGQKCIEEAVRYGIKIKNIFISEGYNEFLDLNPIETTEAILSKISSTTTAPKCVAVAEQRNYELVNNLNKILLLEDIKDAGNLGTILRTCCAFNIDAIILFGDTVDLYNPKCVRASVGNLWKIPVFNMKNIEQLKKIIAGYEIIATLPKSNNSIWLKDYNPKEKFVIMFGSEATGLSEDLKALATKNITIEMSKDVESLNLSISAGVILYKIMQK